MDSRFIKQNVIEATSFRTFLIPKIGEKRLVHAYDVDGSSLPFDHKDNDCGYSRCSDKYHHKLRQHEHGDFF